MLRVHVYVGLLYGQRFVESTEADERGREGQR